jgi:hypothetical protein
MKVEILAYRPLGRRGGEISQPGNVRRISSGPVGAYTTNTVMGPSPMLLVEWYRLSGT